MALIIVLCLLAGFIVIVAFIVCRKNLKCKKKNSNTQEPNSDSDSFEEDDDICVEDAKPKNPFAFKKEIETNTNKSAVNLINQERYKFYGAKLPPTAKAKVKAHANDLL